MMTSSPEPDVVSTKNAPWFQRLWKRATDRRFLFISVLLHVVFAAIAVFLVVQTISPKRKLTFKGGPPSPNPSQRVMEHKVSLAKKQKTMSAPAPAKRITTTGMSKVALPEMPAMPTVDNSPLSKMAGMAPGGLGMTMGSPGGAGGSSGGGGGVPFFGVRDKGKGLPGTLYDLKQTRSRQDAKVDIKQYHATVEDFVHRNFSEGTFSRYFRSANPIYAPQIFIPILDAQDGPKAFGLEKEVKPSRWAILYQGKVRAPESGTFRFVGFADDIMVIRVDKKLVLDGSLANVSGWKPVANYTYDMRPGRVAGFRAGEWFKVQAGQVIDLDILIGEQPGGLFYAQLFLEKEHGAYRKTKRGAPILPIFKVAEAPDPDLKPGADGVADFARNGKVWPLADQSGIVGSSLLPR
jgi:hypothetical protein